MVSKIIGIIFNRISITVMVILIQIIWFVYMFLYLSDKIWAIHILLSGISIAMFFAVVLSSANPVYKISWLALIGFSPVFGGLLYFFFGNKKPARGMKKKLKRANKHLLKYKHKNINKSYDMNDNNINSYIARIGRYASYENTEIKYFNLGEKMFDSMMEDLRQAKNFIFFEYFIVNDGYMWRQIKEVFKEKRKENVEIRMIVDDFGSISGLPLYFKKDLRELGIKIFMFNPLVPFLSMVMNNRDHRKILVIDGKIGYTGGINISDEYINKKERFGHWKDTGVRLEGEAVEGLTLMFLEIWNAFHEEDENDISRFLYVNNTDEEYRSKIKSDGVLTPFADTPLDNEALGENIYMDILWNARDYVYIFTPYLIIDNEMQVALTVAAKRGVDVRLVVPGIPDKKSAYALTKSFFRPLIEAGVKIYTYTPGFIHAKSYVSDDRVAIVGTINMDFRSLYLHFECGILVEDSSLIKDLKNDCLEVFNVSKLEKLKKTKMGILGTVTCGVLRLLSPLM